MSRLGILDPGFENLAGHHYELNRAIAADCTRRGVDARIAAHRAIDGVPAALPVERVFTHSIYAELREGAAIEPLRAQSVEDLDALRGWSLTNADTLLLHSTTRAHFFALGEWIDALPPHERPRCVVLHTVGWYGGAWTKDRFPWSAEFRRAAQRLAGATHVTFAAANQQLCDDWHAHSGETALLHPIPAPVVVHPRPHVERPRFAFVGGARTEKGFDLLPDLARLLLRDGCCELVVQVAENASTWSPTVARLRAMSDEISNLELRFGAFDSAEYARLLGETDVVMLPYDPFRYEARGSGIFFEAMASSRPMILPRYTWMAAEWQRCGAGGALFDNWSPGAIARAAASVVQSCDEHRERSIAAAERWNAKHSTAAFVDFVLGHD